MHPLLSSITPLRPQDTHHQIRHLSQYPHHQTTLLQPPVVQILLLVAAAVPEAGQTLRLPLRRRTGRLFAAVVAAVFAVYSSFLRT
jgi:hypothetical protein